MCMLLSTAWLLPDTAQNNWRTELTEDSCRTSMACCQNIKWQKLSKDVKNLDFCRDLIFLFEENDAHFLAINNW